MFSKSILSSKTFWALLAPAVGAWLGYLQGTVDLQAALGATVMALIGMGMRLVTNGPVHVVTPSEVTQSSPDAPVVKRPQAGFSFVSAVVFTLLAAIGLLLVTMLQSCSALGLKPETVDQSLLQAESTATAALELSDQLLGNKTISLAQDRIVRRSHDVVVTAVHVAHAAVEAGDPAKAQAELSAIQADVDLLSQFLSAHK